ncbi:hypothetical protein Cgig2_024143 [Carnegiea gigantea]|uniref:Uncharacterized protein n=1 Tax=Carnegiea gigantea TaxID=171969 RepID=A0A9Q1K8W9_9CARY|nr:hypothetical protein Cgig2_024143 [Carnegiea gigantea]
MSGAYYFLPNCYSTRRSWCNLQDVLDFHLIGTFLSFDSQISALHVILPGRRVVIFFCNAIISCRRSRILAECISSDCYILTKIEYYGYHGLDLDLNFSTYPHSHNQWLILDIIELALNSLKVCLTMSGCWILPTCSKTHVAPTSSEQPKHGHLWLSPPPIKKSMMYITKPETSLIFVTMVSSPIGMCKGYEWKNAGAATSTSNLTEDLCFIYASEEHCSSKAIDLTTLRPRKIMFIGYFMSLAEKHKQLSKCKPLFVVFTITARYQMYDKYNRPSPTTRNIFMHDLNSSSTPRIHTGRFFTINSMGNPYISICRYCTTKSSHIVLRHNCYRTQPYRLIPRLDP